jgi:hypothetical protein
MLSKVFITITALLFALLSVPASAKIVDITGPPVVLHPGEHFHVTAHTVKDPKVEEFKAVFELDGFVIGTYDLVAHGHSKSGFGSFKIPLEIPKHFKAHHKKHKYTLKTEVSDKVRANLWFIEGIVDSIVVPLPAWFQVWRRTFRDRSLH